MSNNSFVKVDRSKIITDGYVGSCGVYHGFSYMESYEKLGYDDSDREREFARVAAMKLKVARTWFRPDYSQDMLIRFGKWIAKMKELGVEVALQSAWWFTKDVWYFAHEKFDDPEFTRERANFERCCDKLAAWIAKSLEYYIVVKGFDNIKYLSLFTEPTSYASGPVPDGLNYFEAYAIVCRKIHEKLIEYGIRDRVKLIGPNGVFTSYEDKQLLNAVEQLGDVIDIYSAHTYSWCSASFMKNADFVLTGYAGWLKHVEFAKAQIEGTGKPLWFDEYGLSGGSDAAEPFRNGGWYGNYLAQINAAIINGGAIGSFIWLLFDQKYFTDTTNNDSFHNGIHRWGQCYMPGDDLPDSRNARPSWYSLSLLSRYMSGGAAKVFACDFGDNICAAATEPEAGKTSVLAVNLTGRDIDVAVSSGASNLRRYLYDPKNIRPEQDKYLIESDKTFDTDGFTDTLPPFAVALYTDYEP